MRAEETITQQKNKLVELHNNSMSQEYRQHLRAQIQALAWVLGSNGEKAEV